MSELALFKDRSAVPAFAVKSELSALTKSLMGGGEGGKRISIKGGFFRLIDGGKEIAQIEERYLDLVIVAAAPKVGRTFYLAKYDSENPAAPDCWSVDGDAPSPTAAKPQSDRCATCPQNAKGSGEGDSRACRFSQRLAVALVNAEGVQSDVLELQVPATSLFGKPEGDNRPLQAYAQALAAGNAEVNMVVTRIKFDAKSESPKLFWKAMRWLEQEEYDAVKELAETPEATKAITMSFSNVANNALPAEGTPLPPKKKAAAVEDDEAPAPAPKKKAKPAPVEEDDDAPAVKGKKTAPAAPPASNLAAALENWDD